MTKGLVRLCNKKLRLYKAYKSNPSKAIKSKFTHFRNKLKLLLDLTEKNYYRDIFRLFSSNLTQTWKLLNKVLNKDNCSVLSDRFVKDGLVLSRMV